MINIKKGQMKYAKSNHPIRNVFLFILYKGLSRIQQESLKVFDSD